MNTGQTSPLRSNPTPKPDDDDVRTQRPTSQPTSNRNFKEVMRKNSDSNQDEASNAGLEEEEVIDSPASLYMKMFSSKMKKTLDKEEESQSPLLGADLENPAKESARLNPEDALNSALANGSVTTADTNKKVGGVGTSKDEEHHGFTKNKDEEKLEVIAAVDPNKAGMSFYASASPTNSVLAVQEAAPGSRQGLMVKQIEELITQVVDKLYTMESAGQKDTVMTLRNLPLFEGATLKITSFDHANKEFNISMNNLLPGTKEMLDTAQMQNSLRQALQDKGYMVHIMVFTTNVEAPIASAENTQQSKDENPEQEQQQGKQQQEQKQGQNNNK